LTTFSSSCFLNHFLSFIMSSKNRFCYTGRGFLFFCFATDSYVREFYISITFYDRISGENSYFSFNFNSLSFSSIFFLIISFYNFYFLVLISFLRSSAMILLSYSFLFYSESLSYRSFKVFNLDPLLQYEKESLQPSTSIFIGLF